MITENTERIGKFTSSEIFNLLTVAKDKISFGKPAIDYIKEKKMEQRLGRTLSVSNDSRPTLWGKCLESRVFDLLGLEYQFCSDKTLIHPGINYWAGSPDALKLDSPGCTVVDIKNPFTLKSFCEFADCKTIEDVRENHKSGEQYYWQLVSNAILTGAKFAELIFYVPFFPELTEIRKHALLIDYNNKNYNEYAWINKSMDYEIPYLIDKGFYKNLNILRWEVLESDKNLLTEKVLKAGKLLNEK